MSSKNRKRPREGYVWTWLPGVTEPVVAGKLTQSGSQLIFNYGKSYLERQGALALYEPELPLQAGLLPLLPGLSMPGVIRDGYGAGCVGPTRPAQSPVRVAGQKHRYDPAR
jgi:hypothetical protein